jgi:hypothetical protein
MIPQTFDNFPNTKMDFFLKREKEKRREKKRIRTGK